jgi:hypothetical protein
MSGSQDDRGFSPPPRRLIVDRWEGDWAVLEVSEESTLELPRWFLPHGTREGDVVMVASRLDEDGTRHLDLWVDREATREARGATRAILERLRGRDPGGDIVL